MWIALHREKRINGKAENGAVEVDDKTAKELINFGMAVEIAEPGDAEEPKKRGRPRKND